MFVYGCKNSFESILNILLLANKCTAILNINKLFKSNTNKIVASCSPDNQKSETAKSSCASCPGSFLVKSDSRTLVVARIKSTFRQTAQERSSPTMRSDSRQARSRKPISKHGEGVLHWLRVYHADGQRLQRQGRKVVEREKAIFDSHEF